MLIYKNSLITTKQCFNELLDYENISDEYFIKLVGTILEINKMEFGVNKLYTDYFLQFKGKELTNKKEIFSKMGEFVDILSKKDEA